MAPVQRANAYRIACDQHAALDPIPESEREDTIEPVEERACGIRTVQGIYHLAIGTCEIGVRVLQFPVQLARIVDLAIDRQHQIAIGRTQRLRSAVRVYNRETFVDEDHVLIKINPAPVRTAMTLPLRALKRLPTQ